MQNLLFFLTGLCPICFDCVCVGPLWHSNMYLGIFYKWSCIVYMLNVSVHTRCLIKCLNGILVLFWTPMSTKLWGLPWLCMFIMFWSLVVSFIYFDPSVLSHALIMHDASHMNTTCTLDAHTCSLDMFCISLMLNKFCYMFSTYNMILWYCLCSF